MPHEHSHACASASAEATSSSGANGSANPVLVEVTRGDAVESWHRGAFAVVDGEGRVVRSAGDIERWIYPRSAIKPLQALAMAESGAIEAFGLSDREIALACASHNGEEVHARGVESWLKRIALSESDLECGSHLPYDEGTARDLLSAGRQPGPLYNNCSGKHAGFLTAAKQLGYPTKGYIERTHPVQQRVLGIMEQMTGLDDLTTAPCGIDGCGIPTIAVPLGNLALAMARFADPADQPERRRTACARIRKAMAAEPYMVAGKDRFCTQIMQVTGERALIKIGAEGVYCGALPELGLGIAIKADDGAGRAAETIMGRLLQTLKVLTEAESERLRDVLVAPIHNRARKRVGEVRPAADFPV